MYQMNAHFKDFRKLVTYHSCQFQRRENGLKRPKPLSESYTGNTKKSGTFLNIMSPSFFEPVSAAVLLQEMVVIARFGQ